MLENLLNGFDQFFTLQNLLLGLGGVVLGSLVGVLPGIGPLGAMAMLLGLTPQLGATGSLILFAGIYYGAAYGGSTTSILLNVPGESASVITTVDGYQMTKRGRGGAALTVAAVGSFVAGTVAVIGMMLVAPTLGELAVELGPPEYLALTAAGLLMLVILTPGQFAKSALMVALGLGIALVGIDPLGSTARFTFGSTELSGGLSFIAIAMGMFGISEVLDQMLSRWAPHKPRAPKMRELLPTRAEAKRAAPAIARGTGIGFGLGLVPGPAGVISTFASYVVERRFSKYRREFGKGAIEGVAGPESANNAAAGAAFIPLLVLGIPFAPVMALMLSALLLNGIIPGPNFIQEQPEVFWTVIAAMYVANFLLLVLNLPLVGLFTRVLAVPPGILMALILGICTIGVYAEGNSMFDVATMFVAGIIGLWFRRADINPAPLVLAIVLGPTLESSLRQSLDLAHGDVSYFFGRPVLVVMLIGLVLAVIARFWLRRRAARLEAQTTDGMPAAGSRDDQPDAAFAAGPGRTPESADQLDPPSGSESRTSRSAYSQERTDVR